MYVRSTVFTFSSMKNRRKQNYVNKKYLFFYGKSSLSMKCLIYEMSYLLNCIYMKCLSMKCLSIKCPNAVFILSSLCEILNFYGSMYGTYYGFQTLGGVSEKGSEEKKRRTL